MALRERRREGLSALEALPSTVSMGQPLSIRLHFERRQAEVNDERANQLAYMMRMLNKCDVKGIFHPEVNSSGVFFLSLAVWDSNTTDTSWLRGLKNIWCVMASINMSNWLRLWPVILCFFQFSLVTFYSQNCVVLFSSELAWGSTSQTGNTLLDVQISKLASLIERLALHTLTHLFLQASGPISVWLSVAPWDTLTPPLGQITSWQELDQSLHDHTRMLEVTHTQAHTHTHTHWLTVPLHTRIHPHISHSRILPYLWKFPYLCNCVMLAHYTYNTH